jgi:hypothetical protein
MRRWRAVGGRSVERSVVLLFFSGSFLAPALGPVVGPVCVKGRTYWIPGSNTLSSWKYARAAIRSLLNSRALCVPTVTGAVKRGHNEAQDCLRRGSVRAAGRVRES